MTPPGGSGTRARSRELGYADAMREMSHVLRHGGDGWRLAELAEAEAGNLGAAAMMGKVGAWLMSYADYAHGASLVHERPDPGEFLIETVWHPRYGGTAPAELPGIEQSSSN